MFPDFPYIPVSGSCRSGTGGWAAVLPSPHLGDVIGEVTGDGGGGGELMSEPGGNGSMLSGDGGEDWHSPSGGSGLRGLQAERISKAAEQRGSRVTTPSRCIPWTWARACHRRWRAWACHRRRRAGTCHRKRWAGACHRGRRAWRWGRRTAGARASWADRTERVDGTSGPIAGLGPELIKDQAGLAGFVNAVEDLAHSGVAPGSRRHECAWNNSIKIVIPAWYCLPPGTHQ